MRGEVKEAVEGNRELRGRGGEWRYNEQSNRCLHKMSQCLISSLRDSMN